MSEEDSKKTAKAKGTKRKRSKSAAGEEAKAKAEETVPAAKKTKKAKKSSAKKTKKAGKDKPEGAAMGSIATGEEVKSKKQKRKRSKAAKAQAEATGETPAKKAKVQEADDSSQDEQKPKQPMSSAEIIIKARELGITPAQMRLLAETSNSGINFDQYDDIPVTVSSHGYPPLESFAECQLPEGLRKCIDMIGYKKPTPIQKHALPIILGGKDLMASAQTGSGKTAAFLFPIIAACMKEGARTGPSVIGRGREAKVFPLALVMAPTRELVVQIYNEARKFTAFCKLTPVVVYGGVPYSGQARSVEMGCDLLIATPGRLKDMIDRGKISLSQVRFLCLDEADRMLDMGFEPQIREIVEQRDLPKQRGTVMFSATFPKAIMKLAADFLDRTHLTLTVGRVGSTTDSITQIVKFVPSNQKKPQLLEELRAIGDDGRILVFVETKRTCRALGDELAANGIRALAIHGDCEQFQREAALRSFRKGAVNVLVGTSVAARGLDIDNVTHVINFDLPDDVDDYVHRIGRTGRAGHTGTAIAFFDPKDDARLAKHLLKVMEEAKQEIPPFLAQAALRKAKPSRRDTARNRGGAGRRSVWGRPGKSFRSGGGGGGGRRFGGGGGGGGRRFGGGGGRGGGRRGGR